MSEHGSPHGRKIAIVHEWLSTYAGSEKVVEQMLAVYPEADLFCVVDFVDETERGFLGGRKPVTTFIQKLPFARTKFRGYLLLMPFAMEQLNLSGYDIILSSNHAVAKNVITGPNQLHLCYVHSPIRYAWDLQHQYLQEGGMTGGVKSWLVRLGLHYMRLCDVASVNRVDAFLANSSFIASRIRKLWRRDAQVLFPPVDVDRFQMRRDKGDFYVTASRMVPYKKVPLIVEAFTRMPSRRLIVIGDGPDMERVRAMATPNVTVLGYQSQATLIDHMQRAKAFVFAAEEDFGITPVEAQACGTPVIAFGRGGSLETVVGHGDSAKRTGIFFLDQTKEAIIDAVGAFERTVEKEYDPLECRHNAERFGPQVFRAGLSNAVECAWAEFMSGHLAPRGSRV